jgi:hypothetical protein
MNSDATWAADAFGAADLGDARRTARLGPLATVLGAQPSASRPDPTDDPAMRTSAYRCFATDAVRTAAMRQRHLPSPMRRMQTVPLVLAVQDTASLAWTRHPATTGRGPLAATSQQGLLAHTTRARTPEGVPRGLLQQQVWARDGATVRQRDHKARSIDEQASCTWLTRVAALRAARAAGPDTRFVRVSDRAADGADRFLLERPVGVDLLVRAAQDRKADHPETYR